MRFDEIAVILSLAGFHLAITLAGLYRARVAWRRSAQEARADRGTMWRLAFLRVMAVAVAISGSVLAIATPLMLAADWGFTVLPTTAAVMTVFLCGSWVVWAPAMSALDNLAMRW